MKVLLKLEDLAELLLSIFFFTRLDFARWWYPALILVPDLSMLCYVLNARVREVQSGSPQKRTGEQAVSQWRVLKNNIFKVTIYNVSEDE